VGNLERITGKFKNIILIIAKAVYILILILNHMPISVNILIISKNIDLHINAFLRNLICYTMEVLYPKATPCLMVIWFEI